MLTLYGNLDSGNDYKVRLLFAQLGLAHRRIEVRQDNGDTATAAFRSINPNGKVPAVRLEDGRVLAESGAILFYFAQGTPLWPDDPWDRAEVLRWMFFEQYSHEPYIAVNRYILRFMPDSSGTDARVAENNKKGAHALAVMDKHLTDQEWLAAGRYSIADIALYAYTHNADESGFDLKACPAVRRWLGRVRRQPGHVPITQETGAVPPSRLGGTV